MTGTHSHPQRALPPVYVQRLRTIEAWCARRRRAARFFLDLGLQNLPDDEEEKRGAFARVISALGSNVEAVATGAAWTPAAYAGLTRDIRQLAVPQRTLYLELFPDERGRVAEVGEAFEWFATGALRAAPATESFNLQPNSAFFFYFAEFALAAIEALDAAERGLWVQLLGVFVEVQRLYLATHFPHEVASAGFPVTFDAYALREPAPLGDGAEELLTDVRRNYLAPGEDPERIAWWRQRHAQHLRRALEAAG